MSRNNHATYDDLLEDARNALIVALEALHEGNERGAQGWLMAAQVKALVAIAQELRELRAIRECMENM